MFQVDWEKQAWLGILPNYFHLCFVSENGQTGPDKGSGVGNLTIPNLARLGLVSGLTGGVSQFSQDGWEFAPARAAEAMLLLAPAGNLLRHGLRNLLRHGCA